MKNYTQVQDRVANRIDEIREFLAETDNDLLAAEYIVKLVHDLENETILEDLERNYLYGC